MFGAFMSKFDFMPIFGACTDASYVIDYRNNRSPLLLSEVSVENVLGLIQAEDYFPEFNESQPIVPEGKENDFSFLREHFSQSLASVTVVYHDSYSTTLKYLTFYRPSKLAAFLKGMAEYGFVINCMYAKRFVHGGEFITRLDDLDICPLDSQLRYLNGTGWNSKWIKTGDVFIHEDSQHRVMLP